MRTTSLALFVVFVVSSLMAASHGIEPQPTSAPMSIVAEEARTPASPAATNAPVAVVAPRTAAADGTPVSTEGPRPITPAAAELTQAMPTSAPVAAPRP